MMEPFKAYSSMTVRHKTGCGSLFTTLVRDDDGSLLTIFSRLAKAGGCPQASTEVACRLITQALENGASPKELARQLRGIKCNRPGYDGAEIITSCADGIGRALDRFLES